MKQHWMNRFLVCALLLAAAPWCAAESLDALLAAFPAQSGAELDKAAAALVDGGAPLLAELCGRILPEASGDADLQARLALSGLVKHVMAPGRDAARAATAAGVAAAMGAAQDASVRAFLAVQLQWIGGDAEVPALAALLADPATLEPGAAALEAIGTDAAGAALLAAQEAAGNARLVKALGVVGYAPAVPVLVRTLTSTGEQSQQSAAAWALADLGAEEAVPVMLNALAAPGSDGRPDALAAAARLADRLVGKGAAKAAEPLYEALMKAPEANARAAGLGGLAVVRGEDVMPLLLAALDDADGQVRGAALMMMAQCPKKETSAALAKKLKDLAPEARAQVVATLARRDDGAAVKAVVAALGDKDASVRMAALETLGRGAADEGMDDLFKMMEKSEEKGERDAARAALMRAPDPALSNAAAKRLGKAKPPEQAVLLGMLESRKAEEHADKAEKLLDSADEPVRIAALNMLAATADAGRMPRLYAVLKAAGGDGVEKAARNALVQTGGRADAADTAAFSGTVTADLDKADAAGAGRLIRLLLDLDPANAPKTLAAGVAENAARPEAVRVEVLQLLGEHKDGAALSELARMTGALEAGAIRDAALAGVCRQFSRATEETPVAAAMSGLSAGNALRTAEEKRQVLQALASRRTAAAAAAAAVLLDDAEVAQDAAAALADIACMKSDRDKGLSDPGTLAVLAKALGIVEDGAVKERIGKQLETAVQGK
ncbi:MAG: hypothetical protein GX580_16960 [Candidatus Hydrogenedens sp.]|mgnify:CR=1 FL=1|nr:HEAT repeat domain-containing protein [Candidatus Hydrogenedentota bacterium]NLF59323.1 hypothetical protein [Candidatus Hydrogenedens sp.]